jgi:hypothetical protein
MIAPPAAETPPAEPEPAEPEPRPEEEAPKTFQPAVEERRIAHRLEPLKPRPRRKWILFGKYERRPEGDE